MLLSPGALLAQVTVTPLLWAWTGNLGIPVAGKENPSYESFCWNSNEHKSVPRWTKKTQVLDLKIQGPLRGATGLRVTHWIPISDTLALPFKKNPLYIRVLRSHTCVLRNRL